MLIKNQNQIEVSAEVDYLAEQSSPSANRYVFAYTITINNVGSSAARLHSRHWLITDADGKEEEVHGEGVVGEQPYLQPGESFQYRSGAMLKTPVGAMQGHYDMFTDDGEQFMAQINPFTLAVPGCLH